MTFFLKKSEPIDKIIKTHKNKIPLNKKKLLSITFHNTIPTMKDKQNNSYKLELKSTYNA